MFFDVYNKLKNLESRYGDSSLSPAEITALVRKQIRNPDVRVYTKRDKAVDIGTVSIGGAYEADLDDQEEPCIDLYLIYNADQMYCQLRQLNWSRVCFDIAEALGHELVHRHQHRRHIKPKLYQSTLAKDHPNYQEQVYLGDSSEIDAYGFTIAAELVVFYNADIEQLDTSDILLWRTYEQVFADDQSVVLKLREHIVKYLNKLKGGT